EQTAAGVGPHWVAYIGTPDADATYADALARGATTRTPPTDIPTVGRYAVLADPQGATFALFTPANAPEKEETAPGIGDVSWHELYTSDLAAAQVFYPALF